MKIKTLLIALLAFAAGILTAGADTPTLDERTAAYVEARVASGLSSTAFFASDPDHLTFGADLLAASQGETELTSVQRTILSIYASTLHRQGEHEAAAVVYRAAQAWTSIIFLYYYATEEEILEHALGAGVSVYRAVKTKAAPRLGKPELVDIVGESLIGTGITPGPNNSANRPANDWVEWFDSKVASLSQTDTVESLEQAIAMLWNETIGLEAKPESEARNQRIYALRAARALRVERLNQLKGN